MAGDKRIPELPLILNASGNMRLAIWNEGDDVTYGILLSSIIPAQADTTSLVWSPDAIYNTDDLVVFDDKFWISLQDDNSNNIPEEGAFWHQVNRAKTGFVYWEAGLFLDDPSVVLYDDGTNVNFYLLDKPVPYMSTDIMTEYLAGDWVKIGGGGGGGTGDPTTRVAGFRFDSNLYTEQALAFRGSIHDLVDTITDELSSVSYEVRLDTVGGWTAQANIAAVEAWIAANVTGDESSGLIFWIKAIVTFSGLDLAEVLLSYKLGDGVITPVASAKDRVASFHYDSSLVTEQAIAIRGAIDTLSSGLTDELLSVTYQTRLDTGAFGASMNIASVQAWIAGNVLGNEETGTIFWIKSIVTYKAARFGEAQNIFKYSIII